MASINYNDTRFSNLEKDKQTALNNSNSTYDNLINQSQSYYDNLIDQSKDWADKQADIQNQQTDFAIEKIEQQKDKANKDYVKEQKGAYQDYMKQSNAYGSNMQTAGQKGLAGSGWSETIQSGFYNTYQNRYAMARESYNEIVMNYNNNIKEAQLQNSSAIAEIYANAQQQQLELALESFSVIKDLNLNKLNMQFAIDNEYNDRWREIEAQINHENSLAEQIRQFNASLAEQKRQANLDYQYKKSQLAQQQAQWKAEFDAQYGESNETITSGSSGNPLKSKKDTTSSANKSKKTTTSSSSIKEGSKSSTSKSTLDMRKCNKLSETIEKTAKNTPLVSKTVVAKEAIHFAYSRGDISADDVKYLSKKYGLK